MPVEHQGEQGVAPFGLFGHDGGRHCDHDPVQRAERVLLEALLSRMVDTAPGEFADVASQHVVLDLASTIGGYGSAKEVCDIGGAASERQGLPVDHHDRRSAVVDSEEEVVRTEVTVHQGHRRCTADIAGRGFDETPTPDLEAFIGAVAAKQDRESVRLKTVTWNDVIEVITLKLDNQYWPAYEIKRTEDGWRRTKIGS